ncbi:MAG TPA: helix-turn-helix domain-containing protein [Micromonosporaceae bacterium]|nr:helix-turn-helix domain-containing protein [Micromonosporaceae bacterium]
MRYADGGGLTARARARREAVRMQAAAMFAQGVATAQVAWRLRVSTSSVRVWRRCWRAGGVTALAWKRAARRALPARRCPADPADAGP